MIPSTDADRPQTPAGAGAEMRARAYRAQADATRRQAETEPLEQRRAVLLTAVARLTRLAEGEERVVTGQARSFARET